MSNNKWKQYFLFTEKEQKGLVVIGFLLLSSFLLSLLLPSASHKNKTNNKPKLIRLFVFNPNTIDSFQALQLGIAPLQIHHLINYRNKKGKFYKPTDFKKLWGLPIETYNQLLPYIKIDTPLNTSKLRFKYFWTIDINHANQKEWQEKTGMSAREAKLILDYKHYLGVFTRVQQVNNVFGLPDSLLASLRPHLRLELTNNLSRPTANSMSFKAWQQTGLFSDTQIVQILRFRKANKGVIGWTALVGLCDMTQSEAQQLRTKVSFDN
jgi:DNA uptake protein ComE-like DNA-binding protein